MMHDYLRDNMLKDVLEGKVGQVPPSAAIARAEAILEGPEFSWLVQQAKVRLMTGTYRYEMKGADGMSFEDRARAGRAPDFVARMGDKIGVYRTTGNKEMLVDIFNYLLLELKDPSHPSQHFESLERYG